MIIDERMVVRATHLVAPTASAILATSGTTWGPRWVDGVVRVPGLEDFHFVLGTKTDWNPEWGEGPDFVPFAQAKLEAAYRLGHDTGAIVALCPWQLESGENLYPGGVSRLGIVCATSGAKGWVDEALANMVVSAIVMLAHLETDRRVAAEEMVI